MLIDRSLNYGRQNIELFLKNSLPFGKVLDLGAGKGDDLNIVHKINRNAQLKAVECYEPYVRELEAKQIEVFRIDLERERLEFQEEEIDIVITNQILEHVKEIFWIMHEIARVLSVGGKLIVGVPNLASLHNRLLLTCGRQPTPIQIDSAHIRGFTYHGFIRFLDSCWRGGYEVLDFRGANFYPFPPLLAKPLAKLFPHLAWGIFFLLKKTKTYEGEFLNYLQEKNLETNFFAG
jgi:SAM-dependent methyltransferase